jgi:hypothetical protein
MVDVMPEAGAAVPNRTYPYNSVVYVRTVLEDGISWLGSGVLIAPDEVLTAAHLVWEPWAGQEIQAVVAPALNSADVPYGTVSVANVHYFPINEIFAGTDVRIPADQSQHDFALLHLSQPVGAGIMPLEPNFPGGQIHVTGYPGGGPTMADLLTNVQRDPAYSDIDFTPSATQSLAPGMSGGPLWHVGANGQPYGVGVVSTAGWSGEITPEILDSIRVWEAQDHGGTFTPDPASPTALSAAEVSAMAGLIWPQTAAMAFLDDGSHLGADFTALGSAISTKQNTAPFVGHINQDMNQLLRAYVVSGLAGGVVGPSGTTLAIPGQFVSDVINNGLKAAVSGGASLDQAYGGALSQFFGGAESTFMGRAVA